MHPVQPPVHFKLGTDVFARQTNGVDGVWTANKAIHEEPQKPVQSGKVIGALYRWCLASSRVP